MYSQEGIAFQPPKIQCHRGYWVDGLAQNTLASIKKAFELGYKMCEFDIRITKDHKVIMFHDDYIKGRKISEMTLHELRRHADVDTFEELLKWYQHVKSSFYLNVEIKSKFVRNRTLEKYVLELLLKYKVQDHVLISSFNPMTLYYFRKNYPSITRALLLTCQNEPGNNFVIKSQVLNILAYPHFLHLDERCWRQNKYKKLLDLKIPIVLWTCNDIKKVEIYFKQGVYGAISDKITPEQIKDLTV